MAFTGEERVLIDGEDSTGTIGRVGYMLQKDLLLPWRTVMGNVAYAVSSKWRRWQCFPSSITRTSPRSYGRWCW